MSRKESEQNGILRTCPHAGGLVIQVDLVARRRIRPGPTTHGGIHVLCVPAVPNKIACPKIPKRTPECLPGRGFINVGAVTTALFYFLIHERLFVGHLIL